MVNKSTTLETKTEDEPPPLGQIEGNEEQKNGGELPDSYEEISEAIDEATNESVLDAARYVERETIENDVKKTSEETRLEKENYFAQPETEEEYETAYNNDDDEEERILTTMEGEPFFRQEIDKNDLMIEDNPREDFESYFGLYENAVARQGVSFDCICIRRLLLKGIYGAD